MYDALGAILRWWIASGEYFYNRRLIGVSLLFLLTTFNFAERTFATFLYSPPHSCGSPCQKHHVKIWCPGMCSRRVATVWRFRCVSRTRCSSVYVLFTRDSFSRWRIDGSLCQIVAAGTFVWTSPHNAVDCVRGTSTSPQCGRLTVRRNSCVRSENKYFEIIVGAVGSCWSVWFSVKACDAVVFVCIFIRQSLFTWTPFLHAPPAPF